MAASTFAFVAPADALQSVATPGRPRLSTTLTTLSAEWAGSPGAVAYRLKFATAASMAHAQYKRVTANHVTLGSLRATQRYYVAVQAVTAANRRSAFSTIASAVTRQPTVERATPLVDAPGKPKLTVTRTTLAAQWSPSRSTRYYRLKWATDAAMSDAQFRRVDGTTVTLAALDSNRRYYVAVQAIDAASVMRSVYSTAASAVTLKSATPAPTTPAPTTPVPTTPVPTTPVPTTPAPTTPAPTTPAPTTPAPTTPAPTTPAPTTPAPTTPRRHGADHPGPHHPGADHPGPDHPGAGLCPAVRGQLR